MRTAIAHRRIRDSYLELVGNFSLRPIHTESALERAVAVLLKMVLSKPEEEMDAGERDYAEALSMLIQRFEQGRRNSSLPKLAPLDRLKFLMGEQGMNVGDLGRVIGSQPNASLVLHGKRSMSKGQIIKLARHFGVSTALFME